MKDYAIKHEQRSGKAATSRRRSVVRTFAVIMITTVGGITLSMANAKDQKNPGSQWTTAFEQKSEDAFADAFAEDVVLEAAALIKPVVGRDKVKVTMGTASKLYTSLEFTSKQSIGERTWLQWQATIPGDIKLKGVTVLTKNSQGLISEIGIYHSPLKAALAFSEEMGKRTNETLGPGYFYKN